MHTKYVWNLKVIYIVLKGQIPSNESLKFQTQSKVFSRKTEDPWELWYNGTVTFLHHGVPFMQYTDKMSCWKYCTSLQETMKSHMDFFSFGNKIQSLPEEFSTISFLFWRLHCG